MTQYESQGMQKSASTSYYPEATANGPVKSISVAERSYALCEAAGKLRFFVEQLRDDICGPTPANKEQTPSRSGIMGTLIDSADHLEDTFRALQDIRAHLLG